MKVDIENTYFIPPVQVWLLGVSTTEVPVARVAVHWKNIKMSI